MQKIQILTEGDSSLLIVFGNEVSPEINRRISATIQLLRNQHIEGIIDMIPSYCALLINYKPEIISYRKIKKRLEAILAMDVKTDETA